MRLNGEVQREGKELSEKRVECESGKLIRMTFEPILEGKPKFTRFVLFAFVFLRLGLIGDCPLGFID